VKDRETALVIAAAVLLALLACGAVSLIVLFFLPSDAPVQPVPPGVNNSTNQPPVIGPVPPNTTDYDLVIWGKINKGNVESICLTKAKEQAGQDAKLVYQCNCAEQVGQNLKMYRCDIETADPFTKYFANIDCYLDRKECDVETNYGTQVLSFSQLGQLE
jgi:hypothetical protein